jgi:hypothetical protein
VTPPGWLGGPPPRGEAPELDRSPASCAGIVLGVVAGAGLWLLAAGVALVVVPYATPRRLGAAALALVGFALVVYGLRKLGGSR